MAEEDPIDNLISVWHERLGRGEDVPASELCVDRPELIPELERRITPLRNLAGLADRLAGLETADLRNPLGRLEEGDRTALLAPGPLNLPGFAGRIRLLGEIARGGMGAVIRAHDPDLGRDLAVKVMLDRHRNRPEMVRRFVEEARVGGQLQHPGIVPIYDMGIFCDASPYFAMKLVDGGTLAVLLAGRRDPSEDRPRFLAIYEQVCQTVAYAHARRVIHRDLKPANVMVGAFGEVQVMDWGLAKVLREDRANEAGESGLERAGGGPIDNPQSKLHAEDSEAGSILGTLAYMPPEQARGDVDQLDERTDVFALGAILCEIITGRPPYGAECLTDLARQAAQADLKDAFERLGASDADPELTNLVRVSLSREKTNRPKDAGVVAFAIDEYRRSIETRLRTAELARVEAQARAEEERKRRRLSMVFISSVAALVCLGAVASVIGIEAIRGERIVSKAAEERARQEKYQALLASVREARANPYPGWTRDGVDRIATASEIRPAVLGEAELRSEAVACWVRPDLSRIATLAPDFHAVSLAYSPDGRLLALGQFKTHGFIQCSVKLVDIRSGELVEVLQIQPHQVFRGLEPVPDGVRSIAFSPDGRWLAAGMRNGGITVWDRLAGSPVAGRWQAHAGKEVSELAFAGDTEALYSRGGDGLVKRWIPTPNWNATAVQPARDIAVEPGDAARPVRIFAALADGRVARLHPERLEPLEFRSIDAVDQLDVVPGGEFLAATLAGEVKLLSTDGGEAVRKIFDPSLGRAHEGWIASTAVSPDGSLLATACDSKDRREVKLWDIASGSPIMTVYPGGVDRIRMAFEPNGSALAVTEGLGTVLYEVVDREVLRMIAPHAAPLRTFRLSNDGRLLACIAGPAVTVWSVTGGVRTARVELSGGIDDDAEVGLSFHPDQRHLAYCTTRSSISLLDLAENKQITLLGDGPRYLAFSPGGNRLWGVQQEIQLVSWDPPRPKPLVHWSNSMSKILTGLQHVDCISPGRTRILVGARDGVVRMFDRDAIRLIHGWNPADRPIRCVASSVDERWVVAATEGGDVCAFDASSKRSIVRNVGKSGGVVAMAVDDHADLVVTAFRDGRIRLWRRDGLNLEEVLTFRLSGPTIESVALGSDGSCLFVLHRGEHAIRMLSLDHIRTKLRKLLIDWK